MPVERTQTLTCFCIPQFYRPIIAGCGEAFAVGCIGDRCDLMIPVEFAQAVARCRIPQCYRLIIVGCSEVFAIGCIGDRCEHASKPYMCAQTVARFRIP